MAGKALATVQIEGTTYSIRATEHALERMEQRDVDGYVVTGNILALGPERLQKLQEANEEAIIIDKQKDVSVVIGFKGNRIQVVTVIDKANCFVKDGTSIQTI